MISVRFDPGQLKGEQLKWWEAWQKRADDATLAAIDAWEAWRRAYTKGGSPKFKYEFDEKVWGDLKDWLLANVFNKKCAYCETPVARSQFHAEHFRPKGQVKASKRVVTIQTVKGKETEHPGYFWLAYNWENLLPSCALCNTVRGKKNQFPISSPAYVSVWQALVQGQIEMLKKNFIASKRLKNVYYLQPVDLEKFEGRLLLHPYLDKPREHLRFGDTGAITAIEGSEMGQHSIEVYDLDNQDLNDARYEAQIKASTQFYIAFLGAGGSIENKIRAGEQAIVRFRDGIEPYSAAALDYVELVRKRMAEAAP